MCDNPVSVGARFVLVASGLLHSRIFYSFLSSPKVFGMYLIIFLKHFRYLSNIAFNNLNTLEYISLSCYFPLSMTRFKLNYLTLE